MTHALKDYQRRALIAWRDYLDALAEGASPAEAFARITAGTWGRPLPYVPSTYLADVPTVCVRIPTGGGKTFVAAHACGLAAASDRVGHRGGHICVVWLVPSTAIAEQTLANLRDARHPCHRALVAGEIGAGLGPVQVVDADQALSLPRPAYETASVIIVATIQSLRVDNKESRAAYCQNGALISHDAHDPRLVTILAAMHPLVIVDEAHNARTDRSFDALARLSPGLVFEITATPTTVDGSEGKKARLPSNQLISVSAFELHAEQMVKLPLELSANPDPGLCLAAAVRQRAALARLAEAEGAAGAAYLRPLLLVQAQAKKSGTQTWDPELVKQRLIADHGVQSEAIRIATGSERGLDDLDRQYERGLYDPACPVTVIITVEALREGWDCPWAYVLCTLRGSFIDTAAAQIVGRVLRQPGAARRATDALNRAYAVACSGDFQSTLAGLRDALVDSLGFQREEAQALARSAADADDGQAVISLALQAPVTTAGGTQLNAARIAALPAGLSAKVSIDLAAGTIFVPVSLDARERKQVADCIADPPRSAAFAAALDAACAQQATLAVGDPFLRRSPADRGVPFIVPRLALRQGTLWHLIDDLPIADRAWQPETSSALLTTADYEPGIPHFDRADVLVNDRGRVVDQVRSHQETIADLPLRNDGERLLLWLERQLAAIDLTTTTVQGWLRHAINHLTTNRGIALERLIGDQWSLLHALRRRLNGQRQAAQRQATQELLFAPEVRAALEIAPLDAAFRYDPTTYPASEIERGTIFERHYYDRVGAFDSDEERACARTIDALPEIDCWVRNLARRDPASFRLPRRPGPDGSRWFYPDFVARLKDGRILVVEYKGAGQADRDDTRDKDEAGRLWAEASGQLFTLVIDRDYAAISRAVSAINPARGKPAQGAGLPGAGHPAWPTGYWETVDHLRGTLSEPVVEPSGFALGDVDEEHL